MLWSGSARAYAKRAGRGTLGRHGDFAVSIAGLRLVVANVGSPHRRLRQIKNAAKLVDIGMSRRNTSLEEYKAIVAAIWLC